MVTTGNPRGTQNTRGTRKGKQNDALMPPPSVHTTRSSHSAHPSRQNPHASRNPSAQGGSHNPDRNNNVGAKDLRQTLSRQNPRKSGSEKSVTQHREVHGTKERDLEVENIALKAQIALLMGEDRAKAGESSHQENTTRTSDETYYPKESFHPAPSSAPETDLQDLKRRLHRLEMGQVNESSFHKLACYPFTDDVMIAPLPDRFKPPQMDQYDGSSDPWDHLATYQSQMVLHGASDPLFCRAFSTTLKGQTRI